VTGACVICPAKPRRRALTDSRACGICVDQLQKLLDDLDRLLPILRTLPLEVAATVDDTGVRHSTGGYAPAPLRVDVLSLLDDRVNGPDAFLGVWAGRLGVVASPVALAAVLSRIIERDDLEVFARQLRGLHAEVVRVTGEPQPARVATCHRLINGRDCNGPITATPGGDTATCQRCGDEWPRSRWQLLGRLQDA
jgi:hypothetical protein